VDVAVVAVVTVVRVVGVRFAVWVTEVKVVDAGAARARICRSKLMVVVVRAGEESEEVRDCAI
jgi:hypothetical protein